VVVVERVCGTESPQLCHLPLEPSVLLRQCLAGTLQVLAVHLGLLQLRPVISCQSGSNGLCLMEENFKSERMIVCLAT
jgi:hypothetical protein